MKGEEGGASCRGDMLFIDSDDRLENVDLFHL